MRPWRGRPRPIPPENRIVRSWSFLTPAVPDFTSLPWTASGTLGSVLAQDGLGSVGSTAGDGTRQLAQARSCPDPGVREASALDAPQALRLYSGMVRFCLALLSLVLVGLGSLPSPMGVGGAQGLGDLERRHALEARSGAAEYAVPAQCLAPVFRTVGQNPTRSISGGALPSLQAASATNPSLRRFSVFSSVYEDRSFTPSAHLLARPPPQHSEQS